MGLRELSKKIAFVGARRLGINGLARYWHRHHLLVLSYHGVISKSIPGEEYRCRNAVSLQEFRGQLEIIGRMFEPISATDLIECIDGHRQLPDHAIMITFDDGYYNNLALAAPELEKRGIPALIAVISGLVGTEQLLWTQEVDERVFQWPEPRIPLPSGESANVSANVGDRAELARKIRGLCKSLSQGARDAYLPKLRVFELTLDDWRRELYTFMDWDQIRQCTMMGIQIASHTVTHPILTTVDSGVLESELQDSRTAIQDSLGVSCESLVYPNGDVSQAVAEVAKRVGYRVGFSLKERQYNRIDKHLDPYCLDRFCITGGLSDDAFQFIASGLRALR